MTKPPDHFTSPPHLHIGIIDTKGERGRKTSLPTTNVSAVWLRDAIPKDHDHSTLNYLSADNEKVLIIERNLFTDTKKVLITKYTCFNLTADMVLS